MEAETEPTHLLTPGAMLSVSEFCWLFTLCISPSPSPSLSVFSSLTYRYVPLFSSLPLAWLSPQFATRVKLATRSYHIQFSFLQNIHQPLNLGLVDEEKVIIHPENVFGGDLRYGQVPTRKPTL